MRLSMCARVAVCVIALSGGVSRIGLADDASPAKAYDIVLNHTTPNDVISLLHWGDPKFRPAGVDSISGNVKDNSLHVVATKDGLSQVEDLVASVDVPVRQMRLNVTEVSAPKAEVDAYLTGGAKSGEDFLYRVSGKVAAKMLSDFTAKGYVTAQPAITTANNVISSITTATGLAGAPNAHSLKIVATPRANADNSVTLKIGIDVTDGTATAQNMVTRTVPDGQPFVAAYLPPAAGARKLTLYFVTPHLLDMK